MGTYLNPGNIGFQRIADSQYVDKTGLISLINKSIGTAKYLTCISRPRRFGKSYAAKMLCAYYDKGCDSKELFSPFAISKDESFETFRNKYHVISLDITSFLSDAKTNNVPLEEIPVRMSEAILQDVHEAFPELSAYTSLSKCLLALVRTTNTRIFFVIDEWDSIIREAKNNANAQERYLNLLRGWFKNNNFTPEAVAAAYMTGILPIKKDGSQSAISDFQEYSLLDPRGYAQYFGFTEDEVRRVCKERGANFADMKKWYDGYTIGNCTSVYNPYSVMQALDSGKYKSYWKKTSAAETLMTYIDVDQNGLQDDIIRLIAGESIEIDTDSFQNDVETFNCKDDVLTLLVHLGYLTYEEVSDSYDDSRQMSGLVRIPNEEVRTEFERILRRANHKDLIALISRSDKLLEDTLAGNQEEVAKAVQTVHDSAYAPTFYNNEQSLRSVVKMAYLSCIDQYAKVEELPLLTYRVPRPDPILRIEPSLTICPSTASIVVALTSGSIFPISAFETGVRLFSTVASTLACFVTFLLPITANRLSSSL